jgi:SPP1 gp7 family putative phage head morphogenesis protein
MTRAKPPIDELDDLREHRATLVSSVMDRIIEAHLAGDAEGKRAAEAALADQFARTAALASLLGARRLLLEMDAKLGRSRKYAASSETPVIPRVPFREAVAELVRRDPRLARTAAAVSKLYSRERAFAMARSASLKLTGRVQEILVKALREGKDRLATERRIVSASEAMQAARPFTLAYAANVYRTSLATAYSAGRFRMAEDPDVAAEVPGFRFDAVGDADTTRWCLALDGLMAASADPVWRQVSPPVHYQCRSSLSLASRDDFRRAGLVGKDGKIKPAKIPAAALPLMPGFGHGRPDAVG